MKSQADDFNKSHLENFSNSEIDEIENPTDINRLNELSNPASDLLAILPGSSREDSETKASIIDEHENQNSETNTTTISTSSNATELKGRPSACVFVASLSSNLNDDTLCQSVTSHFKQWGEVSLVKVLRDPANRPYAFVQYSNDFDANRAISEGQHSILNGRTVRCEKARVNRTLYIQLPTPGMRESTIKMLLTSFGEIERLVPVNDNYNIIDSGDDSHKNWFCKFVYRQDAISSFANLKTKASWNIEWAQNLEDEYSNMPEVTIDRYSIFVGHLDPRISKEELIERFEKHGRIKEAILVNRPLTNFAFIKFETKKAAASAVERENHSMFKFKTVHVQYREMYNNYSKKFSSENGLKLNLAPPPVNFKRRHSHHHNKNGNPLKSVNFDIFEQHQNLSGLTSHSVSKRFNFSNQVPKRHRDNRANYEHEGFGLSNYLSEPILSGTKSVNSKSYTQCNSEDYDETNTVTTKSNNDSQTMNSYGSFYSSPKTGTTYSTLDDHDGELYGDLQPKTSWCQYPYYYYVPGMEFSNQIPQMEMTKPPPSTSAAYYYSYPSYSQGAANTTHPPPYPYYFYYNTANVTGK